MCRMQIMKKTSAHFGRIILGGVHKNHVKTQDETENLQCYLIFNWPVSFLGYF